MANISISIEGIDQTIENLNYRPSSVKFKVIQAIRSYYGDQESISSLTSIQTDDLIKSIWDIGDSPSKLKGKRRNFSSVKSSINADLEKLSQKGESPENLILTDTNVFDMTDEAKNNLLSSFADAVTTGDLDLDQASALLQTVMEFLDNMDLKPEAAENLDIVDQIKNILNRIGEEGLPDVDIEAEEIEEEEIEEIDEDEQIEEIEDDFEIEEIEEDEELEELELDEEEEIEEDDEDLEVEEIDDDEEIEEIELDEDEDFEIEEIDIDEDEDFEIEEIEDDEDIEEIELDDDDEIEELDDDFEEIELDEDEEIDEIDDDFDIEEIEDDEDLEIEEIDEDELEEIDDDVDIEEIDEDDDIEEIELDEDEDIEEIELDEDEEIDDDVDIEEIDEDDDIEEIDLDEDEDLEIEEIGDDELEEIDDDLDIEEIDEDEDIEEIDLDEDEDLEEIELDEDEDLEIEEIDDDLEELDELDEDELKALEEYRNKKELAEHFDETLGEREKKFNKYTIVPHGLYTIGSEKGLKSSMALQQFEMPQVYIGIYPVTNALFEVFIEETGYVTTAEKKGFGRVYSSNYKKTQDGLMFQKNAGSQDIHGACWYQPNGPGSSLHDKRNHPVVQISVDDAMAFSSWIGRRLPTEAEWEAAARTDLGYIYPWGNDLIPNTMNIEQSGIADTCPVDKYDAFANEFNIADLLGNVMEWTMDTQVPDIKLKKPVQYCIAKGAAWNSKDTVTISSRALFKPDFTSNTIGFRCISEVAL